MYVNTHKWGVSIDENTYQESLKGLELKELSKMVDSIRNIEISLGNLFLLSSSKLHLPPIGFPSAPINIPDFRLTSL